jgi:hypothetical protein
VRRGVGAAKGEPGEGRDMKSKAKESVGSVASLLAELEQAYHEAGLDCGDHLLPPAPKDELDWLAHELELPLPAELVEVYSLHGGQEYFGSGTTGLFGQYRLFQPDAVRAVHRDYCEIINGMHNNDTWDPLLIPFAGWDAYDLCIHSRTGRVCEFTASSGCILSRHRPNIAGVLRELLAAVREGKEPQLQEEG